MGILCMNAAQRRLEIEKMRRSLRDNESIPIPIDYNIMKFVAQIDKRRRKQFGFVDQPAAKAKKTRKNAASTKPAPKKRKSPTKKKAPPKRRKKKQDTDESDVEDIVSEPEETTELEKLEKE